MLKELKFLFYLCMIDLFLTILLLLIFGNIEGHPLFHWLWENGPLWFVGIKLLHTFIPLRILDYAQYKSPRFTRNACRFGIVAYVVVWLLGVFFLG